MKSTRPNISSIPLKCLDRGIPEIILLHWGKARLQEQGGGGSQKGNLRRPAVEGKNGLEQRHGVLLIRPVLCKEDGTFRGASGGKGKMPAVNGRPDHKPR